MTGASSPGWPPRRCAAPPRSAPPHSDQQGGQDKPISFHEGSKAGPIEEGFMYREEKAKVVAASWGTVFLQFLAVLAFLHVRDELNNRPICTLLYSQIIKNAI